MTRKDRDHYVLSTGREFYAYGGALGVARDTFAEDQLMAVYGWDGVVGQHGGEPSIDRWTPEERSELADYAIAQWEAFKAQQ